MLWINYLDTGSERVHTSLEGSLRMEGCRDGEGGGEERRDVESRGEAGSKERLNSIRLSQARKAKETIHDYHSGISSARCSIKGKKIKKTH